MEAILKHACPFIPTSAWEAWLFILMPAIFASLGALLLQGSFVRIVGGALGAAVRDFGVLLAVSKGWIEVTNPHHEMICSTILVFFCASGGALGACLAPYRGKLLALNAFIGGFLGQFALPFVLAKRSKKTAK